MLEHFGFSRAAAAIYTELVVRDSADSRQLAGLCGLDEATVHGELRHLLEAGAVQRVDADRYAAMSPELAGESLIQAKEDDLRAARQAMHRLIVAHRTARAPQSGRLLEVVEGFDNVRAATVSLQKMARTEVRALSRPPYAGQITRPNLVERAKLAQDVRYRFVWDRTALAIPGLFELIQSDIRSGEQTRIFDGVPIKLMIADDRLAVIALTRLGVVSGGALVIHPSELLNALSALFELIWQLASPARTRTDGAGDELTEQQMTLLEMLASGMTDEAIARSLGWSPRTVQRHVRRILQVLGADTRLQAGIEAARRGWF